MAKRKESLVYLDTHVVVWLYDALTDRLSRSAAGAFGIKIMTPAALLKELKK